MSFVSLLAAELDVAQEDGETEEFTGTGEFGTVVGVATTGVDTETVAESRSWPGVADFDPIAELEPSADEGTAEAGD
ncbi:hypothetical protein LFM09_48690 [Lentzea alba]|uniref:hypothetical protein n=1 Tax=Lentzea alba TaxID=2714351 RepID=UPI0039BEEF83